MSYVSKVNKKNRLLKENNNKMLYMSEAIKKRFKKKILIHLHSTQNHQNNEPKHVELSRMGLNLE